VPKARAETLSSWATATITDEIIAVFVEPIIGEGGKDFTGKIVFVDLNR